VVDSSALLAIMFFEPGAQRFTDLIQAARTPLLSVDNFLEAFDPDRQPAGPVTRAQVLIARDAYHRFGEGNHPAGLNFGDCFAYALAKERDPPLLFKGTDFALTDLPPVL
jgi:ribonuclease VapC